VTDLETLATADIVVVGAGISGVCTAYELNRRGFDVVLCDQRFHAFGASGRNPGSLWIQTRRTGAELDLARAGKSKYEEYLDVLGDVFDYRREGGLFFYETEEQRGVLDDYVADRQAAGVDVQFIGRKQALKHAPLLPSTALGAVFCPEDAQLDSQLFVRALASFCVRAGVRTFDNTSVLSTLRNGDEVTGVRTVRGEIHAPGVVWATGAWSTNLRAEGISTPITTARMGHIVTQPIEQRSSSIMHGPRGVATCGALTDLASYRADIFSPPTPALDVGLTGSAAEAAAEGWDYDDWIAVSRSGALHVGSSIDAPGSLNPHIGIAATQAMISTTLQRYGDYAHSGVTGLWAGLMCDTPDHLPVVDRVDNAYVNAGHSWGIASGPICGQVMAEIIAGESSRFADLLRADRQSLDVTNGEA
jgi:glycine/D-amino acid oxidase-like deaminating enzyme